MFFSFTNRTFTCDEEHLCYVRHISASRSRLCRTQY